MTFETDSLSYSRQDTAARTDRRWVVARRFIGARGFIGIVAVLISLLGLFPPVAGAYTIEKRDDPVTGQLVITPTKIESDVTPGSTATRDIAVANRTGHTVTVEFSVEDFAGSNDPSQAVIFMGDEDSERGARSWLEPEINSIVLKQGETVTFRTRINVPQSAEPGGHYAALFATTSYEGQTEQDTPITVSSRVFSLFLLRVAAGAVEEGSVTSVEAPGLSEYGPIDIGIVFTNRGNVHLKPSGKLTITNMLGLKEAEIEVPEWVVLPDSSRRTTVTWDGGLLFGRYTATAEIGFGPDGTPVSVSTTFWVIPWKIVLAITLAILILLWLLVVLMRRRRARREEREAPEAAAAVTGEEVEAPAAEEPVAAQPVPAPVPVSGEGEGQLAPLSELFPSMGDDRTIDLGDEETRKLVRELIAQELDMAKAFVEAGSIEDARRELQEARYAAQRIGLLSELGIIDDMLQRL